MYMFQDIQGWLNLGASATVIMAGATWMALQRGRASVAGSRRDDKSAAGLADGTRSASVHVLNGLINEMTRSFTEIVNTTIAVETQIDHPAGANQSLDSNVERLAQAIEKRGVSIEHLQRDLEKAVVVYRAYHERAQSLRYLIVPSLHAMGNEEETIQLLNETIDEIKIAAKRIRRGGAFLLKEMSDLIKVMEVEPEPKDWTQDSYGLLRDTYDPKVFSILLDPEYLGWTSSFAPAAERDDFIALLKSPRPHSLNDTQQQLINHAVLNLYTAARMRPDMLQAQILLTISRDLLEVRRDCKAFLICLCAISSKLQQQDNGASAKQIFNELSGKDLLNSRVAVY